MSISSNGPLVGTSGEAELSYAEKRLLCADLSLQGMALPFDFPVPPITGDYADHLRATQPKSVHDYVGKEHFFHYASDFGRTGVGNIFHALIAPTLLFKACAPSEIGLVVSTRSESGLPPLPSPIVAVNSYSEAAETAEDATIQIGGLIELSKNQELLKLVGNRSGEPLKTQRFKTRRIQILRVITLGTEQDIRTSS